jgi:hypothetical protein
VVLQGRGFIDVGRSYDSVFRLGRVGDANAVSEAFAAADGVVVLDFLRSARAQAGEVNEWLRFVPGDPKCVAVLAISEKMAVRCSGGNISRRVWSKVVTFKDVVRPNFFPASG